MITRLVTAAAVIVSAAIHLKLWFDGMQDEGVVGWMFLVNVVAGLVIAYLLVSRRHWLPLLLAFGFGASTLGAFVISTTVGLFGVEASWIGAATWIAAASEVVAMLGALVAAVQEGWLSGRQPHDRGAGSAADLH